MLQKGEQVYWIPRSFALCFPNFHVCIQLPNPKIFLWIYWNVAILKATVCGLFSFMFYWALRMRRGIWTLNKYFLMTICLIGTLPTLLLVYMHIHTSAFFSWEAVFRPQYEYEKAISRVKTVNLEPAHFPDGMLMCKTSKVKFNPQTLKVLLI